MTVKIEVVFVYMLIANLIIINGEIAEDIVTDKELYKRVLNEDLCHQQLKMTLQNRRLLNQFLDASGKLPTGMSDGNLVHFGNYFQCLDINEDIGNNTIEGKYCVINIPFEQDFIIKWMSDLLDTENATFDISKTRTFRKYFGNISTPLNYNLKIMKIAICMPKPCSVRMAVDYFYNLTDMGLNYTERFCRLPNDKPWAPVDFVAIGIFSAIGILTILSTIYDRCQAEADSKRSTALYKTFSLYGSIQKVLNTDQDSKSGFLECIDGIRVWSMMWIIFGHAYIFQAGELDHPPTNILESYHYFISVPGLPVTSSQLAVDSFFLMSGLLLVYISRRRLTSTWLLKNMHIFYLNRVIRMLPILAAGILLEASLLHRITDGPYAEITAIMSSECKKYWWKTLFFIQNFFDIENICLDQTWFLAVDVQLHYLSPLVLYWLLRNRHAKTALITSLVISIVGSTIYNFFMEFPATVSQPTRIKEEEYYYKYHYFNVLTRSPPFIIGMVTGYVLSLSNNRCVIIPKMIVFSLWLLSITIAVGVIYSFHPVLQLDWNNQMADSMINSFSRPLWALSLSWVVFACVHGYGGPVNSFLSHNIWKVPSRLSYGMYILHLSIIALVRSSAMGPLYFTFTIAFFRFCGILVITMLSSFILTVFIDAPFSELFRLMLHKHVNKQRDSMEREINVNGKQIEDVQSERL